MQDRFGPLRPSDGVARRRTRSRHRLGYDPERLRGNGTVASTMHSLGSWARWSAQLAAFFAITFVIATVVGAFLWPQAEWRGDVSAFAREFNPVPLVLTTALSFLIIPGFVGLVVITHAISSQTAKPFAAAALIFTAAYAATVGANDFLQISTVRLNLDAGPTTGLSLLMLDNPHSIFSPLEALGYFWQTLAGLLLIPAFAGSSVIGWIRGGFVACAISGVAGLAATVLGLSFSDPFFVAGSALWGIGFPIAMLAAAEHFRRGSRAGKRRSISAGMEVSNTS